MILCVFLTLSAVSASDSNITDEVSQTDDAELPIGNELNDTASFAVPTSTNYLRGETFDLGLTYENGTGIANRTVHFTVDNNGYDVLTDKNGIAKLKLNFNKGIHRIYFTFNDTGFNEISQSKSIRLITNSNSNINAPSTYNAYVGFKNPFKVTLKVDGLVLSNRWVTFKINGVKTVVKTDSRGMATFNVNLPVGVYYLYYSFAGEDKITKFSGKSKITVIKGMPTRIFKANSIIYRQYTKAPLKVKLVDIRGNPLANAKITFKINKKTYVKKTNAEGIATLNFRYPKGTYNFVVYFAKNSKYNKAVKKIPVKVKPKQARNNGMWLFARDMYKVNFKTLQKYGVKHIFLNAKAIETVGINGVEKYISNANKYGIKVHLWIQIFYSGGKWISPVKNGKINYDVINAKIREVKKYSKIKGLGGIHFDYLRFPDGAYKHKNGVNAINYFTKHATLEAHRINSRLIISAAVMPEPSGMKYHYGQDIPTMSKYLDVIVPMVYKGNYHAGTKWIQSTTQKFIKMSKKAKIWTGLQSYKSDSDLTKLSSKSLMNDADAAAFGGARGIILFRYELFNYINFNEV